MTPRLPSNTVRRLLRRRSTDPREGSTTRAEELELARVYEEQLRRRQALEINDNVVQGLTVAKYALDAGDYEDAKRAVEKTLGAARQIITHLLDEGPEDLRLVAGDLVRLEPATVVLAPRSE